jgi:hypothetical protein
MLCLARQEEADVTSLARARGWNEVVVERIVARGDYRTHRFRLGDYAKYAADVAETLRDRGMRVQFFLPEILSDGELSAVL